MRSKALSPLRPHALTHARLSPVIRLALLGALALSLITLFMTLNVRGSWDFVLPFRGRKVLAMITVGYAIAMSTVLFQTITNNRILTPSIMGFDALYMLIQTLALFFFNSSRFLAVDVRLRFGVEVVVMVVFASGLYWWLFVARERSLHLLVLVGIVFGVMFSSFTNLMQRVMDPTKFAVLQDAGFASFNAVNEQLLGITLLLVLLVAALMWRMNAQLDALALGRDTAINLGVNYKRAVMMILAATTLLVAVSTALVGPITFFGLLVANLAYVLVGSSRHRHIIVAAGLLAIITLVGGQLLLEHVFSFNTSLSVITEFAGGIVFIFLLIRGAVR